MTDTNVPQTTLTRWLLDTRSIWPGTRITDSNSASACLDLISEAERKAILRKYHIADSRMSLASALLKRAYIHHCTGLSWSKINFTRKGDPQHGKPAWKPPDETYPGYPWPRIDFNISHQAGLVTLVGACTVVRDEPPSATWRDGGAQDRNGDEEVLVGCDIVCVDERRDLDSIRETNFDEWTSGFGEIFSYEELWDITYTLPSNSLTLLNGEEVGSHELGRLDRIIVCDQDVAVTMADGRIEEFSSDLIIEEKMRRFYTFFALKEAYIKLVGEGLLAPWIKKCEFRGVRAPKQGTVARCSMHGVWGGKVTGGVTVSPIATESNGHPNAVGESGEQIEIWLSDEEIVDVRTEVQAFEENFMIATMVRPGSILADHNFPEWHRVDLESDIWERARVPGI